MAKKFTKKRVQALPVRDKRYYEWDGETEGFGVRVHESGRKVFVFRYRFEGRRRVMTLGEFGPLTVDEGRKLALKSKRDLIEGSDPLQQRHDVRKETVKDLGDLFISKYAKLHKRSWEYDQGRLDRYINPALGNLRLTAVRKDDVETLHEKIAVTDGKRNEGRNVVALLSKMFNWAKEEKYVPADHHNPAKGVRTFPVVRRKRSLRGDEIPLLVKAIRQEQNPLIRVAVWLYLLWGLRKSDLLSARWENFNEKRRTFEVFESKVGKWRLIPLSDVAIGLMKALPKLDKNPFLFPSDRSKSGHLVNIDKGWRRIRESAGLQDVKLHDLRRTVGSWAVSNGETLMMTSAMLGHSTTRVTEEHYAHLADDPKRAAFQRHADRVVASAGIDLLTTIQDAASEESD